MRRMRWWGVVLALLLVVGSGHNGGRARAELKDAQWQIQIDGRKVGGFHDIQGLEMEFETLEFACRPGKDNDCDGVSTEAWLAGIYKALWEADGAAAALEEAEAGLQEGAPTAAKKGHETSKNAIQNIRGRMAQLEEQLGAPTSLKTKHDTVKNSISNIRAMARGFSEIAINEPGYAKEGINRLEAAVTTLNGFATQWTVRKRPGRVVYGNITVRTAPGTFDPIMMDWGRSGTRKSGSIIYLDREGKEVMRFNFYEGWPARWVATDMVEEMEFVVERVQRVR